MCPSDFRMEVFLTDDGSKDGTGSAVKRKFPSVKVLQGNGSLYWNGGMRNSWNEALTQKIFDGFLLLNDDVEMDLNSFCEILFTHEFSVVRYGKGGIYIGSLRDNKTLEYSYGGRLLSNKLKFTTQKVLPDGSVQECHLGNGNLMFVSKNVVEKIGIFSDKYIHAKADHDYTLRASKNKLPVLVCPHYCGYCNIDHESKDLTKMSLKERVAFLKSPTGIEISGYMYFMWRFFPLRAPFVFCFLLITTLLPAFSRFHNNRG